MVHRDQCQVQRAKERANARHVVVATEVARKAIFRSLLALLNSPGSWLVMLLLVLMPFTCNGNANVFF